MRSNLARYEKELKVMFYKITALLVIPFILGTIGYAVTKNVSLTDAFVLTIESVSFLSDRQQGPAFVVQTLLIIIGLVTFSTALAELVGFVVEGKFKRYFKEAKHMDTLKKLNNHIIICGGGRVGESIADGLKRLKEKFVIIDKNHGIINHLENKGYSVIEADAMHEEILEEAGIKKAKSLIVVFGETERNVLLTLTAKEMNPDLLIYARSDSEEYNKMLKKAGAIFVISPELNCAQQILERINKKI
ncbi:NAD-binding protein [Candidatus Woesearchaeota archaeon]|nr:NAD-binding protein [Candidatus Woesearchaeota archaeon]